MADDVVGKCPVCSSDLEEWVPNLRCSKHPDHYSIRKDVYDGLWEEFEKSPRGTKEGDALLSGLLDNNQVSNPPEIKRTVMSQLEEELRAISNSEPCVVCGSKEDQQRMVFDNLVGGKYHEYHDKREIERIIAGRLNEIKLEEKHERRTD